MTYDDGEPIRLYGRYYTPRGFARRARVTSRRVQQLVERNRVRAVRIGRAILIPESQIRKLY